MSDQTPSDASYKTLVVKFIDQMQGMEGTNLLRYHRIGHLFSEFLDGLTCGRYGTGASLKRLAEDLQRNGVLTEIRDPQRMLYYSKAIFAAYPNPSSLVDLAKQGFTVTHSKLLMICEPDVQKAILANAVVNGRFVSSRQLMAMVVEARGEDQTATAAIEQDAELELPAPAGDGGPTKAAEWDLPTAAAAVTPELPGNPPLPTPEPGAPSPEIAAAATTNTLGKERTVAPKKALSNVNTLLDKLMVALPDVFIVVKESAQIGTDNPHQNKNYLATIADIAIAAKGVREILTTLIEEIDGEVDAGSARDAG